MGLFSGLGNYLFGVPPVSSQPYASQAQQLQSGAGQYAGQEQTGFGNQEQLQGSLWNAINGVGPSVADIQLQQTLDQNLKNGMAMGAGASGPNAVLARYLAATQTGDQAAKAAQTGALLRAKEIADARQQYAGNAANMAQEGAGMYGRNLETGLGYANLANSADQAQAGRNQQAEAAGLQFLSGLGSMFFGRQPGGGGGGGSGGGGVPDSLLGSSDPGVSNAAWDAFAA